MSVCTSPPPPPTTSPVVWVMDTELFYENWHLQALRWILWFQTRKIIANYSLYYFNLPNLDSSLFSPPHGGAV